MWEAIKGWLTVVTVLFGAAIVVSLLGFDQFADVLAYIAVFILGMVLRMLGLALVFGVLGLLAYLFVFLPAEQIKKYKLVRRDGATAQATVQHQSRA